jgi:hypothetical protein
MKAKRSGAVAQAVESLPSKGKGLFNPQNCQKKVTSDKFYAMCFYHNF